MQFSLTPQLTKRNSRGIFAAHVEVIWDNAGDFDEIDQEDGAGTEGNDASNDAGTVAGATPQPDTHISYLGLSVLAILGWIVGCALGYCCVQ